MRRIIAGIGGLGLAVTLSQFPEYAQQYTQRLGGAVDELRVITEDFDRAAIAGGLDRSQALGRYGAAQDSFLTERGTAMTATFARYELLSATLERIEHADPVTRFQSLPAYLDSDIGRRTLDSYTPAMPVSMEGFLYAGAGLILGYLVLSGFWHILTLPFRRRRPVYRVER